MRLIDAEALPTDEFCGTPMVLQKDIDSAPTIDAVPVKHGEWMKTGLSFLNPNRFRNYCCSVCGYDIEKMKYNYCPNCGAKMDGGEE